jgi:hypothetical protein
MGDPPPNTCPMHWCPMHTPKSGYSGPSSRTACSAMPESSGVPAWVGRCRLNRGNVRQGGCKKEASRYERVVVQADELSGGQHTPGPGDTSTPAGFNLRVKSPVSWAGAYITTATAHAYPSTVVSSGQLTHESHPP